MKQLDLFAPKPVLEDSRPRCSICGKGSSTQIQSVLKPEPHLACRDCADAEIAACEALR
jgi:hypothetical protein